MCGILPRYLLIILFYEFVSLIGLYYLSPFIRSLVTCPVFLGQLEKLTGEPVVPHFQLMNAAAANFGSINDPNSKVVDHWHFDSVAFVAVTLVSDITDMQGGELQLLTLDKKAGLSLLKKQSDNRNNTHSRFLNNATTEEDQCEDVDVEAVLLNNTVTVPYEQSGACILIQGSEVLHRVTRVLAARENRISLVMSLQPANVFHPDKTIFHTWDSIFDKALGTAPFEYFRMQVCIYILMYEGDAYNPMICWLRHTQPVTF